MLYHRTPIQEILRHPVLEAAGVRLLVKREDLNHPHISGNKWWKLKYNLQQAKVLGHSTVLTFGGAYSNHIFATAAGAAECGLRSVGIIRGEETLPLNSTLAFARSCGMILHYVPRATYRQKQDDRFMETLTERFGPFYTIPEGGTNLLGVKGCVEFAEQHLKTIDFNHLFLPIATGGTTAGIIAALKGERHITGVSVLKGGAFLTQDVTRLLMEVSGRNFENWNLLRHDHHGGYAKVTKELLDCISEMRNHHQLPLDHVYTGKLFLAIFREVQQGTFSRGDTILALHTGGLQGSTNLPAN